MLLLFSCLCEQLAVLSERKGGSPKGHELSGSSLCYGCICWKKEGRSIGLLKKGFYFLSFSLLSERGVEVTFYTLLALSVFPEQMRWNE